MADIYFNVVRYWLWGALKKMGQAVIHQLHYKNQQVCVRILVHAQVLDNFGVSYGALELTFLLKPPHW